MTSVTQLFNTYRSLQVKNSHSESPYFDLNLPSNNIVCPERYQNWGGLSKDIALHKDRFFYHNEHIFYLIHYLFQNENPELIKQQEAKKICEVFLSQENTQKFFGQRLQIMQRSLDKPLPYPNYRVNILHNCAFLFQPHDRVFDNTMTELYKKVILMALKQGEKFSRKFSF